MNRAAGAAANNVNSLKVHLAKLAPVKVPQSKIVVLSPLFEEIKLGHPNLNRVRELLDAARGDRRIVYQRNNTGSTPLINAVWDNKIEVVRVLLEGGVDPNLSRDDDGTALDWAATRGHTTIVKLLAEYGAQMTDDFDTWIQHISPERRQLLKNAYDEGAAVFNSKPSANSNSEGGAYSTRKQVRRGGYRASARNLKYLRKYKRGESIGFTMTASLKAKGLIPRTSKTLKGKKVLGRKYKTRKQTR
jgi:hypothetical protein